MGVDHDNVVTEGASFRVTYHDRPSNPGVTLHPSSTLRSHPPCSPDVRTDPTTTTFVTTGVIPCTRLSFVRVTTLTEEPLRRPTTPVPLLPVWECYRHRTCTTPPQEWLAETGDDVAHPRSPLVTRREEDPAVPRDKVALENEAPSLVLVARPETEGVPENGRLADLPVPEAPAGVSHPFDSGPPGRTRRARTRETSSQRGTSTPSTSGE